MVNEPLEPTVSYTASESSKLNVSVMVNEPSSGKVSNELSESESLRVP